MNKLALKGTLVLGNSGKSKTTAVWFCDPLITNINQFIPQQNDRYKSWRFEKLSFSIVNCNTYRAIIVLPVLKH